MAQRTLHVDVVWRTGAPAEAAVRARVRDELQAIGWELTQLQALVHDAHQATGCASAWLVPKMELRLPLYDLGRRYRVVLLQVDRPCIVLLDEDGKRVADVRLV